MAFSLFNLTFSLLILSLTFLSPSIQAQQLDSTMQLLSDSLQWQSQNSHYDEFGDGGLDQDLDQDQEEESDVVRRALYWHARRFYISYGALSANRIPCPPRSGRSYYTHNCYKARGAVHPYNRGCSRITRCRSGSY